MTPAAVPWRTVRTGHVTRKVVSPPAANSPFSLSLLNNWCLFSQIAPIIYWWKWKGEGRRGRGQLCCLGLGRGVERHQGINSNRCVISVAATEHVKLWLMIGTGLIWPSGTTLRVVYAPEVTWGQVAKGAMFGRGRKLSTRFTLWTATPQIKSAVYFVLFTLLALGEGCLAETGLEACFVWVRSCRFGLKIHEVLCLRLGFGSKLGMIQLLLLCATQLESSMRTKLEQFEYQLPWCR